VTGPVATSAITATLESIAGEGAALASITVREVLSGIGLRDPGRRGNDLTVRFQCLFGELHRDRIVQWAVCRSPECIIETAS